jgi:hypothetical protein
MFYLGQHKVQGFLVNRGSGEKDKMGFTPIVACLYSTISYKDKIMLCNANLMVMK